MASISAHIKIEGLVQGVGYRAFTADTARSLGLCGWVRNLLDGSVEALFEGDEDKVQQALNACRTGPPRARVEHISMDISHSEGEFRSFDIRY
ncbi:MAG: acylphosphatase [Desulfuromonadaceae bacterium]|nr:acylphosphatase [Geobacteraceae bacterium]